MLWPGEEHVRIAVWKPGGVASGGDREAHWRGQGTQRC